MPPHAAALAFTAALFAACASAPSSEVAPVSSERLAGEVLADEAAPCVLDGAGVFYVAGENPVRPRVRYADGQVSLDDHCAIRVENRLNRRIPPVYVNGRPIGFC